MGWIYSNVIVEYSRSSRLPPSRWFLSALSANADCSCEISAETVDQTPKCGADVRCTGYGWCVGKIVKKVTRGLANFIAKFEIDDEPSTLTLSSSDYDTSPDAEYNAWMIVESEGAAAEAETAGAETAGAETAGAETAAGAEL